MTGRSQKCRPWNWACQRCRLHRPRRLILCTWGCGRRVGSGCAPPQGPCLLAEFPPLSDTWIGACVDCLPPPPPWLAHPHLGLQLMAAVGCRSLKSQPQGARDLLERAEARDCRRQLALPVGPLLGSHALPTRQFVWPLQGPPGFPSPLTAAPPSCITCGWPIDFPVKCRRCFGYAHVDCLWVCFRDPGCSGVFCLPCHAIHDCSRYSLPNPAGVRYPSLAHESLPPGVSCCEPRIPGLRSRMSLAPLGTDPPFSGFPVV